jgi:hypothetical protein
LSPISNQTPFAGAITRSLVRPFRRLSMSDYTFLCLVNVFPRHADEPWYGAKQSFMYLTLSLAIRNLIKWNIFHNDHISASTSLLVFPKERVVRVSETENCYNCVPFHEVNFLLKLLSECCKWHCWGSTFKNFLGGMPPDPPRSLAPTALAHVNLIFYKFD